MSTIDIGKSGNDITITPDDLKISRGSLGSVKFHNGFGADVTVTFTDGSPFTESSKTIGSGSDWDPHWAANVAAEQYDYQVTSSSVSPQPTPQTGDIDISTTPIP